MGEAVLKISKGLLEAMLLPTGAIMADCKDMGDHIECVVYGSPVPAGCKRVRAIKSQEVKLVPADD